MLKEIREDPSWATSCTAMVQDFSLFSPLLAQHEIPPHHQTTSSLLERYMLLNNPVKKSCLPDENKKPLNSCT